MKNFTLLLLFLFSLLVSSSVYSDGFLRRDNQNIVDGTGTPILLRGMGLGGWMLQEGYMMQTSSFAPTQHELKEKIADLIGTEKMREFYDAWLANHCRKIDIDSMAAWGFNSVRLPMHYNLFTLPTEEEPVQGQNTWLETGFELTDDLLSWCEQNQMYLILDLHAAPGGQGYDAAISDYDDSKPSLWESAENRAKTVALWRKLAERYAYEEWIGGYDLINETNWDMAGNAPLKQLYLDITSAIREVDANHMIIIEGNWFANDFTGLTPPWDDNMIYSFHKYWSHNDQASIQWMLNIRNNHNIPIWCGEAGENSNHWFTQAIRLFEDNNIGWAWWPLKKVESISGPLSIIKPEGYQILLDYWEGNGTQPTADFAEDALMKLAENAKLENCEFNPDVIDAMFRQVRTDTTIPYGSHFIPGTINAVDFDLGRHNRSYRDNDIANYQVSTDTYTAWNNGWSYRNDGVDIEACADVDGPDFNVGWIENNEWLKYTIQVNREDSFKVAVRIASLNGGGQFELRLDDEPFTDRIDVPQTGGWQDWSTIEAGSLRIPEGRHAFRIQFLNGGFNLNQIRFDRIGGSSTVGFQLKQNHPNPFNPLLGEMVIPFTLNDPADVQLSIYNVNGQTVYTSDKIRFDDGDQVITWNGKIQSGKDAANGVYLYRLRIGNQNNNKRMLVIR